MSKFEEFKSFLGRELSSAETIVLDEGETGNKILFSENVPFRENNKNSIGSDFIIKYLSSDVRAVIGKPRRLAIAGAFINGDLDLEDFSIDFPLMFAFCHIRGDIRCADSRMSVLWLDRSKFRSVKGNRLKVLGTLSARNCICMKRIYLRQAEISGSIDFAGIRVKDRFNECTDNEWSVEIRGAIVGGSIRICDGAEVYGGISLKGVRVSDAINFRRSKIYQQDGSAISLSGAKVDGPIFFDRNFYCEGDIKLSSARVDRLVDSQSFLNLKTRVSLDGFKYNRLLGEGTVNYNYRYRWLLMQPDRDITLEFKPQPFQQCASVLKDMGHFEDSKNILYMKSKLQNASAIYRKITNHVTNYSEINSLHDSANKKLASNDIDGYFSDKNKLNQAWNKRAAKERWYQIYVIPILILDYLMRYLIGYGYKTHRLLLISFLFIGLGYIVFSAADKAGAITPDSDIILVSDDWNGCVESQQPRLCWETKAKTGDYETFSPIWYAVDVFVPIIELGQDSAWSPSRIRGGFGVLAWYYRLFSILSGWIVVSLGIVGVASLIRTPE